MNKAGLFCAFTMFVVAGEICEAATENWLVLSRDNECWAQLMPTPHKNANKLYVSYVRGSEYPQFAYYTDSLYDKTMPLKLEINGEYFELFWESRAWYLAKNQKMMLRMVQALTESATATIIGYNGEIFNKGSMRKETYILEGASASFAEAARECGVTQPKTSKRTSNAGTAKPRTQGDSPTK
jgi:hypothetical protein